MTHDAPQRHTFQWWYGRLQPQWLVGTLFALSLLAYLALIPVPRADGQLIGSDGVGYYVYVRSLVIDGDLDFSNEYRAFQGAFNEPPLTPIGRPGNKFAIGPALLWMPFFLVAHGVVVLAHALGAAVQPDGYNYVYQAAISVGSIVYGALGFALALGSARRLFGATAATSATATLWLASNAIYYMVFEPSMSHMVALFCVALLWSRWLAMVLDADVPRLRTFAALGAAGGLVLLVRVQDVVFLLVPYATLIIRWLHALGTNKAAARRWCIGGLASAACTVVVFLPQIIAWHQLYGTWLTSPYTSDHNPPFYWLQPQIGGVLFSTFHGLFSWHPIFVFALLGLFVNRPQVRWLSFALLATLALNVYLVAAWWAWWQGDSFGGRMFLSATWLWVVGLSGLYAWLNQHARRRGAAIAVVLLLVMWNGLSLVQYRLGFVPMSKPLSWQQMTIERLYLPWLLVTKVVRH